VQRSGPPSVAPRPPEPALGRDLAEKLRAIAGAIPTPGDAIEPALQMILEATAMPAGAVCLFDAHQHVLRLVAESGLSDEGCRVLRSMRQDITSSWDMPLRSLLSRRAYLIENASENPYVPALVDDPKVMATVACLPLYADSNPVGSLIIVAVRPKIFPERYIRSLEDAQQELVAMIEALRQEVARARAAPTPPQRAPYASPAPGERVIPILPAPAMAEAASELERVRSELGTATAAVTTRDEALAALRRTHDALTAELGPLRAELERLRRELDGARERDAARLEQIDGLARSLDEARDALKRERHAHAALKERVQDHRGRTDAAMDQERARADAAAAQVEAAEARVAEHAARVRALEGRLSELESAAVVHGQRAEELTGALAAERARIATLETELDSVRAEHTARATTLAAELEESRHRLERESALLAEARQSHDRLVERLAAAEAREREHRAQIDALEGHAGTRSLELEQTRAERRAATHARGETATTADALESAQARLDEMTTAISERALEIAEVERRAADAEARGAEMAELLAAARAQLEQAEARAADAEGRSAETAERLAAARTQLEQAEARAGDAEGRITATEALAADAETRSAEMAELLAAARTQLEQAEAELAAARTETDAPEQPSTPAIPIETVDPPDLLDAVPANEAIAPADDAAVAPEASAGPVAPPDAGAGAAPERLEAVIIDGSAAWDGSALGKRRVAILTAVDDRLAALDALTSGPALLNLAAPGALLAAAAVRAAGRSTRFLGYLAAPGADRGLGLGTIEITTRPMDPESVLAMLRDHVTRGTRLLTAGADADAFMSLRQGLSRQGASVSMAWDANQAADLLATVRPAVAVIDLDLPPRGAHALVAALTDLTPAPTLVLIASELDAAARFAAEAADRTRATRLVPLGKIATDLLRAS
jgi:CheY-like chemotaxis protein